MRGLILLSASALAIEDFERDALGAPGPTRANLRGRGLKFGHSVTEVEEEATAPPTVAIPAFLESLDCADCLAPEGSGPPGWTCFEWQNTYGYDTSSNNGCICYVGELDGIDGVHADHHGDTFRGSPFGDCIAITGFTGDYFSIEGGDGDDLITVVGGWQQGLTIDGQGGDDTCPDWAQNCEAKSPEGELAY